MDVFVLSLYLICLIKCIQNEIKKQIKSDTKRKLNYYNNTTNTITITINTTSIIISLKRDMSLFRIRQWEFLYQNSPILLINY